MGNISKLSDFLWENPTAFHVVNYQAEELKKSGYQELFEEDKWKLKKGGKYFVRRNSSSIIAFDIPKKDDASGFMIMASHSDSPALKLKENPEMDAAGKYTKLNVETYGGGLWYTWFDKPLSVAGRILVSDKNGIKEILVNIDRDLFIIPSLAIHMNREANTNFAPNAQKDLLPLAGLGKIDVIEEIAREYKVKKEEIQGFELFLYNRTKPGILGMNGELFAAPHLDDASAAFCSLEGFLKKKNSKNIPLHVVFDNEEVGSLTKQGAASTFLYDVTNRINLALSGDFETMQRRIAKSFMLSADNAHAIHPNCPEKCDPVNHPAMGEGVVLKFSANQKYTTDAVSAAVTREIAKTAKIKLQDFFNRSDMPGGSTLGNISGAQLAIKTADIGLAQLAMHSNYEVMASKDVDDMIALAKALYER